VESVLRGAAAWEESVKQGGRAFAGGVRKSSTGFGLFLKRREAAKDRTIRNHCESRGELGCNEKSAALAEKGRIGTYAGEESRDFSAALPGRKKGRRTTNRKRANCEPEGVGSTKKLAT